MTDAGLHPTPIGRWRARLGLSQRAAAEALGMTLRGYQEAEREARYTDQRPRKPSRVLLLACAAVERDVESIT